MAWSMTEARYNKLLNRLTALEESMNDTFVALENYATTTQIQELLVILTQQINNLSVDTAALEERVVAIEEEPLT